MKNLVFKTNARHIGQLGRELVTDFVTALVELIKNSYDADAECTKLIFQHTRAVDGKIILLDTGEGMTQEDFEKCWMTIGTSNKMTFPYTTAGRKKAGKKGIGRFSVERLAEKVTIYSFPKNGVPFQVEINWNKFEELDLTAMRQRIFYLRNEQDYSVAKFLVNQIEYFFLLPLVPDDDKKRVKKILGDEYTNYRLYYDAKILDIMESQILPILEPFEGVQQLVEDIKSPLQEIISLNKCPFYSDLKKLYDKHSIKRPISGLVVCMEGLRDEWQQKNIDKLQKELRLLVAPDFLEKDPFIVEMEADEFTVGDEISVNEILEVSFAHVEAFVTENGKKGYVRYLDKDGRKEERNYVYEKSLQSGDFSFDLYYFIRDSEHMGIANYGSRFAQRLLDTYCGVKIYRDNFRVKPYGDEGNDWLFLDQAKVRDTHGYLVGNNQTIGRVNISDFQNPRLVDATNREGIIENAAYTDMRDFVLQCVKLISEIRREKLREKEEEKRRLETEKNDIEKKKKNLEKDKIEVVKFAEKVKHISTGVAKRDKNSALIVEYVKKNEEYQRKQENYQKRFEENANRRYDTVEQMFNFQKAEANMYKNLATLGMLASEFGHETSDIVNRIAAAMVVIERSLESGDGLQKSLKMAQIVQKDFKRISAYSQLMIAFLRRKKRENIVRLNVADSLKEICEYYKSILDEFSISLEYQCGDNIILEMKQIDLESIIINMITNAYGQLKKCNPRNMAIYISQKNDLVIMSFEDSGPGVQESERKHIFQAFVSTKDDGIGLGLSIVKDIVERYKGTVSCEQSQKLGGARFVVKFKEAIW